MTILYLLLYIYLTLLPDKVHPSLPVPNGDVLQLFLLVPVPAVPVSQVVRQILPRITPEIRCQKSIVSNREEDPDGSADFWPARSGSITFFIGSESYL